MPLFATRILSNSLACSSGARSIYAVCAVNLPDLTVGAYVPFAEMIASGMAT